MNQLSPVEGRTYVVRPASSGCGAYDAAAHILWLNGAATATTMDPAYRHELSHFLLHVSTPYGRVLDECALALRNCVLSFCTTSRPFPLYLPIYDTAVLAVTDALPKRLDDCQRTRLRLHSESDVVPWSRIAYLMQLLEGSAVPGVRIATESDGRMALVALEERLQAASLKLAGQTVSAGVDLTPVTSSDDSPLPACLRQGAPPWGQTALGGQHIFESMAQLVEGEGFEAVSEMSLGAPYLLLWASTLHEYGIDRLHSTSEFREARATFFALCDLSLFTPLGQTYAHLRRPGHSWADVQPGLRFFQALAVVQKLGWLPALESELSRFQDAISDVLNWARPTEFLEVGANLSGEDLSTLRHRQACQVRLGDRASFLTLESPGTLLREFFKEHRPLTFDPVARRILLTGGPERALDSVLTFILDRYCNQVMQDAGLDERALSPAEVSWSGIWANVESFGDLLNLIYTSVPQLSPERLTTLPQS